MSYLRKWKWVPSLVLDSSLDQLDIFEFLQHVEDELKDHYDIKVSWREHTWHTLRELGADEPYQCVSIGTFEMVSHSTVGVHTRAAVVCTSRP